MGADHWLTIFFVFLLGSGAAWSQTVLTSDDVMRQALRNNLDLQAEEAQLKVEEAEITRATIRTNPLLVSEGSYVEDTYRVGITSIIEPGGKRQKRIALAESLMAIAKNEYAGKVAVFQSQVQQAYLDAYLAQEKLRHLRTLADVLTGLTAEKHPTHSDEVAFKILKTWIRTEFMRLEIAYLEVRQELAKYMGRTLPDNVQFAEPTLPEPAFLLEQFRQSQPVDVSAPTALGLQVANRRVELARANRIPNLLLGLGSSMVTSERPHFGAYYITSIEMPLFDRNQHGLQAALALQEQARTRALAAQQSREQNRILRHHKRRLLVLQWQQYQSEILPENHQWFQTLLTEYRKGNIALADITSACRSNYETYTAYLEVLKAVHLFVEDPE